MSNTENEMSEWVRAPRERTEAMHRAAQSTTTAVITHEHSAELWRVMLAAASSHEEAREPKGGRDE